MRESQERSGGKSTTITRAHRVEFKRRYGSPNKDLDCRTPPFYALIHGSVTVVPKLAQVCQASSSQSSCVRDRLSTLSCCLR